MNKENLGWAVSGALAMSLIFVVSTGFQEKALKLGTVNVAKVFDDSEIRQKLDVEIREFGTARENTFNFLATYPMLATADLKKFRELSLKLPQTDADKAELERLRKAGVTADQKYRELQTKPNATDAEKTQLATYQRNVQENERYLGLTQQEFSREITDRQSKMRADTLLKVKAAISEISQKQGYSIVFSDETAPYAANDLTPEALKAINAKK